MSHWLQSEQQQQQRNYHTVMNTPTMQHQQQQQQHHHQQQHQKQPLSRMSQSELQAAATAAVAEDPALAFMLRLDSVVGVRGGIVTCLATVRRNVHHYELVYLQRFKQIAEPAIRHPKSREQHMLMCLDPKMLKCGQQVLLKVHSRQDPTEPLQLLRECSILRANGGGREASPVFPRAYLFGCLGNNCWRVASTDEADGRQLVMHKQHFLLCQYVEDSLQRLLDSTRSRGESLPAVIATRLAREMLSRVRHLHSLGWLHGDLRPACFALAASVGDELLLNDFASAAPIASDCLQPVATVQAAATGRSSGYRGCRFVSLFADLESVVYILCSLLAAAPLPWEVEEEVEVDVSGGGGGGGGSELKAALWRFVEAFVDDDDSNQNDADDAWTAWRLDRVFNCARSDVGQHPAFRLAGAITRLHREAAAGTAVTVRHYDLLAECLR